MTTNTIGTRMTWATTAKGSRTVPVLLITGMPCVFTHESGGITSCSLSGTIDSAWWPGASADLSSLVKPWLSLPHGVRWTERLIPTDPQALDIGAVEVMLSDAAGAATALFAARDSVLATDLSAEVTATDTTVNVVSTTGFDASGSAYLGREAFTYSGVTATSFTGVSRAKYGSVACRHPFAGAAGGVGIEAPVVTAAPFDVVGRPASLWMCTVSSAGVITAAELEFFGHIGIDAALADDGDAWLLRVDHAVHKLSQPPRSPSVTVAGYTHTGNAGVRSGPRAPTASPIGDTAPCPLYAYVGDELVGTPTYAIVLSDEASTPDSGGWHRSREAFVEAWNIAAQGAMSGGDTIAASLTLTGALEVSIRLTTSGPHFSALSAFGRFVGTSLLATGATGAQVNARWTVADAPLAWVPIDRDSRVYLSATDYAVVPTLPTNPSANGSELYYALAFGAEDAPRYARITGRASSGGVQYVTATALATGDLPHPPFGVPAAVEIGAAFTVREPSSARVAMIVRSDHWVDAIEALLLALDSDAGDQIAQAIDWVDMRARVSLGGAIPLGRSFIYDAKQTPLEWLVNECALAGFSLTLKGGRISMVRIAEFAITEATAGTITSADLVRDAAVPSYARGRDGVINKMSFKWPVSGRTLNVIDTSSVDRYGASRTALAANLPINVLPQSLPGDALFSALWTLGMTSLGPYRRPVETVTVSLTLAAFDLQLGDLVGVTLWRVPNDSGTRGVSSVVGQVIAREPDLYGDQNTGVVKYTLRFSPSNLAGWAPSILVRAAGISGAVVTADVTTFGSTGFAPVGQNATYGFAIGDKVRLIEIDSASPTTATQHTVTAVSATTISLSPSPNATFTALCASALKAIVIPDDYDTSGLQTGQKRYGYLAVRSTLLLATGVRAQRIAA